MQRARAATELRGCLASVTPSGPPRAGGPHLAGQELGLRGGVTGPREWQPGAVDPSPAGLWAPLSFGCSFICPFPSSKVDGDPGILTGSPAIEGRMVQKRGHLPPSPPSEGRWHRVTGIWLAVLCLLLSPQQPTGKCGRRGKIKGLPSTICSESLQTAPLI